MPLQIEAGCNRILPRAGTPAPFLAEWQSKVRTDRDSVKKHEIARDVLRRLNEGGDKTLAQRREVLKRVAEFDDFSSCWDNDRYKAQGLVSQIQRVINVKDSFTRINLEREKERKERQAVYNAAVEAKRKENERRQTLKTNLYRLFAETDPYKRGKQLEGALNDLFAFAGFLIREAFTVKKDGDGIIEQIDGVVEIDGVVYLVEMKWWDKPIGRQEIAPHLVSVYGRGDVAGIFISYSGYSPAAIEDARIGLAQKVFVLAELQEIVHARASKAATRAHRRAGHTNRLDQAAPGRCPAYCRDTSRSEATGAGWSLSGQPVLPSRRRAAGGSPSRERREDIPALCELFLMHAARDLKVAPRRIGADAMRTLLSYDFPGNIRELRDLVERACILSIGDEIAWENFPVTAQTRTAGVAVDRASRRSLPMKSPK